MEHILLWIVVHVAEFADVVVQLRDAQLLGRKDRRGFFARPGKVVAIVIERNVGVLRRIKPAALLVAQPLIHPAHDVLRNGCKLWLDEGLKRMNVVAEQAGVVVKHLLEMRDDPALIDGIAMESSSELIVDSAPRHLCERDGDGLRGGLIAGARRQIGEQVKHRWMGKLGLRPEPAIAGIELRDSALYQLVDDAERERIAAGGEGFAVLDGGDHARCRLQHFVAAGLPGIGQRQQHALEARAAIAVFTGEVGAREKGAAVGSENRGERPTALAADGLHRCLVARVDVRALVAINLDGDEMLIDGRGHCGVFVGFAIHYMAPVAPHRAYVQKDRLPSLRGEGERCLPPFLPVDGLMHCGAKVGGSGFVEGVARFSKNAGRLDHAFSVEHSARCGHEAAGGLTLGAIERPVPSWQNCGSIAAGLDHGRTHRPINPK